MSGLTTTPIAGLPPDVLLEIFDLLTLDNKKGNASLISAILCCQKWRPLASSILYRHVALDPDRLELFSNSHTKCKITSLTVKMDAIGVTPGDPSAAIREANNRNVSLRKLCSFLEDIMPVTLSISVDMPFPCTAGPEIESIVKNLPGFCSALEVDLRHSSSFNPNLAPIDTPSIPQTHPHLCDSIRAVLPQLRHLRLRLPVLCTALFSADPLSQDSCCHAIHVPLLKTCLINLSLRQPFLYNHGAWATECSDDYSRTPRVGQQEQVSSALPPMEKILREFAHLNKDTLKRLWVVDVKPVAPFSVHDHAAWIRRDFISNASYPMPVWDMGVFRSGGLVARIPSLKNPEKTEDWVSTTALVETVAEGGTWAETSRCARLPTRDLENYEPAHWILSGSEYRKKNHRSCMIWKNEHDTGEVILPQGPGDLMQRWDMHEIVPPGWKRDNLKGSIMVRI
ncbi:hypothetical protein F4777DRAFT_343909 [Nemania sp. FL0916]|nr:hypothetical protein F4777DRAFT_343909 [Nemania sp. FL0916]